MLTRFACWVAGKGEEYRQRRAAARKHEEIIICDSCHYSTDIYNAAGVCNRCLRARMFWNNWALAGTHTDVAKEEK